jgi:hypothetical protein
MIKLQPAVVVRSTRVRASGDDRGKARLQSSGPLASERRAESAEEAARGADAGVNCLLDSGNDALA